MLRNLKRIIGLHVDAEGVNAGRIEDFYFEEEIWNIRYFVVHTGNWLKGRHVLISPAAFTISNWETGPIPINISKEQLKNSPSIDLAKPLTRKAEEELHLYYGWPFYWIGFPGFAPPGGIVTEEIPVHSERSDHLQSAKEKFGCKIEGFDGNLGTIKDFLAEDGKWIVRYAVVDAKAWLPGREILLCPQWLRRVESHDCMAVHITRTQVKESPIYHPLAPVDRPYEEMFCSFYDLPRYWKTEKSRAA